METEFSGYVRRATDESRSLELRPGPEGLARWSAIRPAAIEIETEGEHPYKQLASLVGRRIKVTVID